MRYIGSSNFAGWQVADADVDRPAPGMARSSRPRTTTTCWSGSVEAELVPACVHYGVGILPFFPLASGLLTGKYRRGEDAPEGTRLAGRLDRIDPARFDLVEALEAFAAERGISLLDVAIGGLAGPARRSPR